MNEENKDFEAQWALLAGEDSAKTDMETKMKMCALRSVLLNGQTECTTAKPNPDSLPKILKRLEKEGVLPPESKAAKPSLSPRQPLGAIFARFFKTDSLRYAIPAAFSLILVCGLGIVLYKPGISEIPPGLAEKSRPALIFRLIDPQPRKKAEKLATTLKNLGVQTVLNEQSENTWEVYAPLEEDLSQEQSRQFDEFLQAGQWTLPSDYALHIKISTFYINPLEHGDPEKLIHELRSNFTRAGAQVQMSQVNPQVWRLDIQLPEPPSNKLKELMEDYELLELPPGHIHIEIQPAD